jgi:hypothetical protein
MNETIKWQELTPEQRDCLVAVRLMGWVPKECEGSISWDHGIWRCLECGKDGTRHEETTHNVPVPRYSESMDAAWEVVEHLRKTHYTIQVVGNTFRYEVAIADRIFARSRIDHGQGEGHAVSAPEAICIASLRVNGIEVMV